MPFDTLIGGEFSSLNGENGALSKRPYIATNGRHKGRVVIAVNTGQLSNEGQPVYAERPLNVNADSTLRKDEWINLDNTVIEAAQERLVIVADLMAAGLTYNVGGLGTMVAEWETASDVDDASLTMDGDTVVERDRQEFGLHGVPIPLIHKDWKISERALLASRTRGASLDVSTGAEMARAVARTWESMVFNGATIGAGNYSSIPGLTNYADRETYTISNWADTVGVTPEDIFTEILAMVAQLETSARAYGPFTIYVPGAYASRFREDFKEYSDKTLMERVTDEEVIARVRFSDTLAAGNVVMLEMRSSVIDLAMAADVTTVQWQSGSGMTSFFKTYAASAPRIKSDHAGRCGIIHGSTA